jgi:glycosyltransferase involved in cell wall biosynthesis
MERRIARIGLGEDVILLGATPRAALRDLYASSDVFVAPAIREAFGIAALEARCMDLPVIAMRHAGPARFVRDGVSGLLADDDSAFALHMTALALDDGLRGRLALPDRGLARYAWSDVVEDNVRCYDAAIARAASMGVAGPASVASAQ